MPAKPSSPPPVARVPGRVVTIASASTTSVSCGSVSWNQRTSLP